MPFRPLLQRRGFRSERGRAGARFDGLPLRTDVVPAASPAAEQEWKEEPRSLVYARDSGSVSTLSSILIVPPVTTSA